MFYAKPHTIGIDHNTAAAPLTYRQTFILALVLAHPLPTMESFK